MMRYIRSLERKDIGLDTSMIPLGSCTMKLNAASEMLPVTWPEFSKAASVRAGRAERRATSRSSASSKRALCEITGFAAVSLQPNSGAQGEFAGLMVIRAYHRDRGDSRPRRRADSGVGARHQPGQRGHGRHARRRRREHAAKGNIDVDDLEAKADEHSDALAALMVTYPSTHGVFEESIQDICAIVHEHGGQVYMDGANMNAQVGLTSPAAIGADVCHLNLHKTFAIPHGGGGPGHGADWRGGAPGAVPAGSSGREDRRRRARFRALSAAPWGSASILLISYAYIKMLGGDGMTDATRYAILNANYIKSRLEPHYPVLYTRRERPRRARDDLRPAAAQAGERASTRPTSRSG